MSGIGSEELPLFGDNVSFEEAQAALDALQLGDGLPLVPPTRSRLARMLQGVAEPSRSFGQVPPLFGELTVSAVAYQCVLAGCVPAELPVVLAAVTACLEPDFNLLGIQTTTGTPTVAAIVHGPIAARLGMNASANCLGPGNRANACIGRAIRLALTNIGGAHPGVGDMATMGQPGKYTFAFAEVDDPWAPPLHVRRGFTREADAVTVLGVSGTMEVLPVDGGSSPQAVLRPMLDAMRGARLAASAGRERPGGEQFFLLPPEMARMIERGGWDLAAAQDYLFNQSESAARIAASPRDIHPIVTGGAGLKMTYPPLWMGGTRSVTRAIESLGRKE
ncbi:hypothetical protein [Desertibaculum subflavum]|uniref:hypothetical protein n=1 Tax=Desertibaculum subflavum TaxID=2268458 RepID=UPI000E66606B